MPVHPFLDKTPRLGDRVFVAPSAHLTGDIEVGTDSSFFFGVVARGDVNSMKIGERSNVQDGSVLHVTHERYPLEIGNDVVIGHAAVVHGCVLEDGCLIGIGARVLDGAIVETGSQVAAGAVVAPRFRVPAGYLAVGVPARLVRRLSPEESAEIRAIAARYVWVKDRYAERLGWGVS